MFKQLSLLCAALLMVATPASANTAATTGEAAPDFEFTDTHGEKHMLSDFKGQPVVLEWSNHGCPFVVKHYDSGNMQKLQKEAMADDVTWITIVSSAEGKQGYTTAEEANKIVEEKGAHPTYKTLDSAGTIGHLYGAKTTPHMFVIDKDGTLVYQGAIDDNNSHKASTVEGAHNYVTAALESLKNGTEIETSETMPYGCSVKY